MPLTRVIIAGLHLGTSQLAINNQGQQTWKIHNDTFGNTVLDPNNQITLNLRFSKQYYVQETDYLITILEIIIQKWGVISNVIR